MNDKTKDQVQWVFAQAKGRYEKIESPEIESNLYNDNDKDKASRLFHGYCYDTSTQTFQQAHVDLISKNIDSLQSKLNQSQKKQAQLKQELSKEKQETEIADSQYIDTVASGNSEKLAKSEAIMKNLNDNSALLTRQINAHNEANIRLNGEIYIWGRLKTSMKLSLRRQEAENKLPELKAAYESFITIYKASVPEARELCPEKLRELGIAHFQLEPYSSLPKTY